MQVDTTEDIAIMLLETFEDYFSTPVLESDLEAILESYSRIHRHMQWEILGAKYTEFYVVLYAIQINKIELLTAIRQLQK